MTDFHELSRPVVTAMLAGDDDAVEALLSEMALEDRSYALFGAAVWFQVMCDQLVDLLDGAVDLREIWRRVCEEAAT